MRTARLDGLTGLRFLAALLVVAHHTLSPSLVRGGLAAVPVVSDLARMGFVGVTFFFVLSGFVLTWSWDPSRDRRGFYGRRFARVWPLHAATYVLMAALVLPWAGREIPDLATSGLGLLLVQSWSSDPHVFFGGNAASWSLSCEAFFYAVLPFLLPAATRLGRRAVAGVVVGAVLLLALAPLLVRGAGYGLLALSVLPLYRLPEFLLGVLLGLAVRRGWRPGWSTAQAGAACLTAYLVATVALHGLTTAHVRDDRALVNLYGNLLMLLPFVALIAAVACADVERRASWLATGVMVRLGEASFALYLVHSAVIVLTAQQPLGHRFLNGLPLAVHAVLLSVGAASVLHAAVERPLERRIRSALVAREARRRAVSVREVDPAVALEG